MAVVIFPTFLDAVLTGKKKCNLQNRLPSHCPLSHPHNQLLRHPHIHPHNHPSHPHTCHLKMLTCFLHTKKAIPQQFHSLTLFHLLLLLLQKSDQSSPILFYNHDENISNDDKSSDDSLKRKLDRLFEDIDNEELQVEENPTKKQKIGNSRITISRGPTKPEILNTRKNTEDPNIDTENLNIDDLDDFYNYASLGVFYGNEIPKTFAVSHSSSEESENDDKSENDDNVDNNNNIDSNNSSTTNVRTVFTPTKYKKSNERNTSFDFLSSPTQNPISTQKKYSRRK